MRKAYLSWPALLLCPCLALANLTITYALVTPSCASQQHGWLHTITITSVAVSSLLTLMAAHAHIKHKPIRKIAEDKVSMRPFFLTSLALWSGLFFTLTLVVQSLGQWLLSPCL
jgi:hypothetical protein